MTIPYPSTTPEAVTPPSGSARPRLTFLGTGYLGATYAICFGASVGQGSLRFVEWEIRGSSKQVEIATN